MKCVVLLNEAEKLTLEQLSLNHRHRDIRNRAADMLLLGCRLSASKIAARLGVSVPSPYNWAKAGARAAWLGC
jgi:transposase